MAPTRAGVTGNYIESPYQVTIGYGNPKARITQGTGADWFGPLDPIRPIAPPEIASRQWDFQAGYNLQTKPRIYEPITFQNLRDLADSYDVMRLIIETRKDEISRLDWAIRAKDEDERHRDDPRIDKITEFLKKPNGLDDFDKWMRILLEDMFVIDAATLYIRRTRGGKLFELHYIDGATIKPVIDDWGRTPQPSGGIYPVAYQQILKGYPAVDYTVRDLIYWPRNRRANHVYGYSHVEQIVTTINIALRRQLFTLNYYTEGNIPDSLIGTPPDWSLERLRAFQQYWDEYFGGDLAHRRKGKFVPGQLTYQQLKEPALKGEFDEWLTRIVCYAFSVSPQWAVKQMNRGTAETQRLLAEEEGLRPIKAWVSGLINHIIKTEFDADDLEFCWEQDEDPDEQKQATILDGYASKGFMTINEVRQELGREPYPDEVANQPMIVTAAGWVPIGANTLEAKKQAQDMLMEASEQEQPEGSGGKRQGRQERSQEQEQASVQ